MEGNQNNAYFEQQEVFSKKSEDDIIQRISDCQMIVERLESDPVWQVVLKDATEWCERLDSNWQDIEDDPTRNRARVLKNAYIYLKRLPTIYSQDLQNAKEALNARRNVETKTPKDYDLETKTE